MHDEPLEQDAGDLLLNHLRLRLCEQIQQHAAEVVRVLVGVPELVRDGVEEGVPSLGVELVRQLFRSLSTKVSFIFFCGGQFFFSRRKATKQEGGGESWRGENKATMGTPYLDMNLNAPNTDTYVLHVWRHFCHQWHLLS